ncbi:DNA adenine methylase [Helicobacter mehlei]|uniref:site-specific DNA-methyltransferase (adenine-specific) n=1 Tax=Helicobacter mehlei TaxID=2316080 RepID=A0A553UZX2_9HELI|nr:DNA adenine methylase [Helicobacter mehlei]TSA85755.1 DNA adenine methylase [Helicobacter mehlei]
MYSAKKSLFLDHLRSQKRHYKRYTKSPLRYGGGKSLAVGFILEHMPARLTRVISPFMGGGSVEIACARELGLEVLAFDIFDILVNFWQVLLKDKARLYEALLALKPTQDTYNTIKTELKAHYQKERVLDPLTLARDYYFNFNLSYGPGFLGWMSKIYTDEKRYYNALAKLKNFDAPTLSVQCADFKEVLLAYPNDFAYLDPPYFLEGDSKMFKGIYPMRNFPIHHNGFAHEQLAQMLKNRPGPFILSYNDCAFVREAYQDFNIVELAWQYTMGQGETRMGKNRLERGDVGYVKKSHELLIIKE